VASYWPEFQANGKGSITVSELLSHRAGLSHFDEPKDLSEIPLANETDSEKIRSFSAFLAKQTPKWELSSNRFGYHAITLGCFLSELVRAVDPKKRSLANYFQEEIAIPYDINFHFGIRSKETESHLSRLYAPKEFERSNPEFGNSMGDKQSLTYRAYNSISDVRPWTARKHEIPSAIGFGNAQSISKLIGIIANGGSYENKQLLSKSTINEMAKPLQKGYDLVQQQEISVSSAGLWNFPLVTESGSNRVLWHYGYGGSMGYADLDLKIGFSFTTNSQRVGGIPERDVNLLKVLYSCLKQSKL